MKPKIITITGTLNLVQALAAADAGSRIPVEGPLCVEGEETGDGRLMCDGAIYWDGMLPIPIVFDIDDGDHSGTTLGAIETLERRDHVIWGVGYLSASDVEEIQALVTRAAELLDEGAVGVSLRFDSEEVEVRVKRSLIEESAVEDASIDQSGPEMDDSEERIVVARYSANDAIYAFTSARVRHLAIVDTAASANARLSITGGIAAAGIIGDWDGLAHMFEDPNFGDYSVDSRLRYDPDRAVWSCPPTLNAETGAVFGHITPQGICLRGRPERCVTPPDGDLQGFMRAHAPAAGGLRTGVICVGGGHCGVGIGAAEATQFYDNTGRAVADVRVGKDRYGVWFAGMARPGATQNDLYDFCASDVSGHWEYSKAGRMTLVGLPAVNVGGFPKGWMTYDEFRGGLAASAALTIEDGCGAWDALGDDDVSARLGRIEIALGEMYAAHLRSQEET